MTSQTHTTSTEVTPAPRPKGRNLRWAIIGVITLLTITNYLDRGNLSVAAPTISKDLGISHTEMGLVLSAFVWPYAVMNLPSGWLVDRFGPKVIMALAAVLWSVAGAFTGFARGVGTFLGLRATLGVAEAPMFPAALKATSEWFPDTEKGRATSVYIAATQVGLAIAPPIATGLLVWLGWPAMFVLMGLLGLIALAAWLVLYRDPERHSRLHETELRYIRTGQQAAPEEKQQRTGLGEWLSLFRHAPTWTMIIGGFCLQYVFWFYITWLPTYLQSAQHFTITSAGLLAALPYVAGGVAVLLGGRVSDLLVQHGSDPLNARRWVIAAGALLTAIALLATAASSGPAIAVVLLIVGMFTYSLSSGPYWTLATEVVRTPKLVASIGSIQNFGGFLGGAFAPVATGFIVDSMGGFVPALVVAGALALISAVCYGLILRRRLPV
ncbi:MAG TPA: MFS transporter [Pseudonocardiaceae bacterium]|jgi:D-galactonate transporter|nr:MFS transporter [Pseudonocardiaceae bacterium]